MCSTSDDMQYESGTSSVQVRMCSMSEAHLQYKRECAAGIRHIISTRKDVQYKRVDHQVLVGGGGGALLKNTFQ